MKYLKSNMDRFIALTSFTDALTNVHLKSNMDRFIGSSTVPFPLHLIKFKIQYG